MPLSRAISSKLACHSCRATIVRSFASINPQNATIVSRASWATPGRSQIIAAKAFATTAGRRQEQDEVQPTKITEGDVEVDFLDTDGLASSPTSKDTTSATTSTSPPSSSEASQLAPIPWYLRAQRDRERTAPETEQSAREIIPDLPPNPPPLLQTLLEYISITAGLDDLALMDLRNLDPPPALGTKLIMVIGSARSEKHLHVSADRFCRWLRREHGLRANADGLLGRNELKIKLRRKAKRMKMLANVGGQEPEGNIDDGIRTGWICCTIGKIEAHPEDTHMPGASTENFVGFNDVKPGVNIVIQMFTEEKRAETDLETLWGGVLRTHERNDRIADEELGIRKEDQEAADVATEKKAAEQMVPPPSQPSQVAKPVTPRIPSDTFPEAARKWAATAPSKGDPFPSSSSFNSRRQIRRIHTVGLRL